MNFGFTVTLLSPYFGHIWSHEMGSRYVVGAVLVEISAFCKEVFLKSLVSGCSFIGVNAAMIIFGILRFDYMYQKTLGLSIGKKNLRFSSSTCASIFSSITFGMLAMLISHKWLCLFYYG